MRPARRRGRMAGLIPNRRPAMRTQHQLRAFNRLGAEGWGVYEDVAPANGFWPQTATWLFNRRVP